MDFDGDEILDLVSGSYDPGELYLFRGTGLGNFAARDVIVDKSSKPILKVPNQKDRVESFGSWMAMVDWDDDGDLDILVGTWEGMMFLRRNDGSRTKPAYSDKNEWLIVGDKRLRVPGGEHANPVIADWDGDGLWDVITGAGNGGVYWYRNVGKKGGPRFAAPVTLVAAHEGIGYDELLDPKHPQRPGIRSQIAVTDYDGDGKLDVLVGDFRSNLQVKPNLTDHQRAEFERVVEKRDEAAAVLRSSMDALRERFAKEMNGIPKSEWESPEYQEKWQQMYRQMKESAPYKAAMDDYERLGENQKPFVDSEGARFGAGVPHGFVWLFRRR